MPGQDTQSLGALPTDPTTPANDNHMPPAKRRRGFAAMDPAKQRELASKGGKASHEQGTGHEWSHEAASAAGRKGGLASRGGRGKLPPTPAT